MKSFFLLHIILYIYSKHGIKAADTAGMQSLDVDKKNHPSVSSKFRVERQGNANAVFNPNQFQHSIRPSSFREANFTRIMSRIAKMSSYCSNMPNHTVIITTVTGPAFDLLLLGRELIPISRTGDDGCVLRSMIVVCMDIQCMRLCKHHNVKPCTRFPGLDGLDYPTQYNSTLAFKTIEWRYVTYLKYEVFYRAFELGVGAVLMLDADVLVLRNPFADIMDMVRRYDILHQAERYNGISEMCDFPINSGVLFIKNNDKGKQVVDAMLKKKHDIIYRKVGLEQFILEGVVSDLNATRCMLPPTLYTGHCQYAHKDNIPLANVTTYHVHCTKTYEEKVALMYHFMNMVRVPGSTFNQAELKRDYFDEALQLTDPDRPNLPKSLT